MATLTVRRFDDGAYARLRERAKRNNRSLEAEARDILEERVQDHHVLVEDLQAFHARMRGKYGVLDDSTPLIRTMRETG